MHIKSLRITHKIIFVVLQEMYHQIAPFLYTTTAATDFFPLSTSSGNLGQPPRPPRGSMRVQSSRAQMLGEHYKSVSTEQDS